MNQGNNNSNNNNINKNSNWNALGLWTELVDILTDELHLTTPTAVQQLVLPELLQEKPSHHVAFLAATGSGTFYI
jgi:superfamily II DNA/RNA helicase